MKLIREEGDVWFVLMFILLVAMVAFFLVTKRQLEDTKKQTAPTVNAERW